MSWLNFRQMYRSRMASHLLFNHAWRNCERGIQSNKVNLNVGRSNNLITSYSFAEASDYY
jgi:hypothetical protein